MDQLTAHLDHGWDLVQRGDTRGAEASARRALELAPDAPEAHNLLGYVAALEGDCDEAIEAYQQAVFLDETYVEAMLNAAELLLHPMEQHREAIDMCDHVLDVTEFDDERVDALLIKFEALMGLGEAERARQLLASLPEPPYGSSAHCYLAGRAHFETGNLEQAGELFDAALELDPDNAEAHYHIALLSEERGDRQAACAAFLRTRQLELELGVPPWAPNADAFMLFTEQAVKKLDPELARFVERAEMYIADVPGPEMVVDGVDPRSLSLIDAVLVPTEAGDLPALVEPETTSVRIFLYALNILRAANALHAVEATIHEALAGELGQTLEELRLELLAEQEPVSTTQVIVG